MGRAGSTGTCFYKDSSAFSNSSCKIQNSLHYISVPRTFFLHGRLIDSRLRYTVTLKLVTLNTYIPCLLIHLGMPSQPPPLLKPSVSQAQRHPPPLQPQVGVPRSSQGGLQGPPPLIKPMVPPIRPQVSVTVNM